jgi:hypothetical protein
VREQDGEERGGKRRALPDEFWMRESLPEKFADGEKVVGRNIRDVASPTGGRGEVRLALRNVRGHERLPDPCDGGRRGG